MDQIPLSDFPRSPKLFQQHWYNKSFTQSMVQSKHTGCLFDWRNHVLSKKKKKNVKIEVSADFSWDTAEKAFSVSWDWSQLLPHPFWILLPTSGFPLKMSLLYACCTWQSNWSRWNQTISEKICQKFPHYKLSKIKKQTPKRLHLILGKLFPNLTWPQLVFSSLLLAPGIMNLREISSLPLLQEEESQFS